MEQQVRIMGLKHNGNGSKQESTREIPRWTSPRFLGTGSQNSEVCSFFAGNGAPVNEQIPRSRYKFGKHYRTFVSRVTSGKVV